MQIFNNAFVRSGVFMAILATSALGAGCQNNAPNEASVDTANKMTVEELGRSLKAQYPQYDDFSDSDFGQKMLQKYPERYQGMVSSTDETPAKGSLARTQNASNFSKKQECAKYIKGVEGEIDEFNRYTISARKRLIQVCYSPTLDTCVAIIRVNTMRSEEQSEATYVDDLLTKKSVSTMGSTLSNTYFSDVAKEIKRLGCED